MKNHTRVIIFMFLGLCGLCVSGLAGPPNILFCISDDQSWEHTSAYGYQAIQTPNFDRVAREGILFNNAFAPSPGCSPTRAAMLTGRHIWQIENAGTHASSFSKKYATYPDLLEKNGYFIGGTGKLWGPGNYTHSGRQRNPAGPEYNNLTNNPPYKGINKTDYAANFEAFLTGQHVEGGNHRSIRALRRAMQAGPLDARYRGSFTIELNASNSCGLATAAAHVLVGEECGDGLIARACVSAIRR